VDKSFFRFVTMHACDRRTDGQTDRILIARPRLHYMQRGKNILVSFFLTHCSYYSTLIENPMLVIFAIWATKVAKLKC